MKCYRVVSEVGTVVGVFFSHELAEEICAEYNRVHAQFDFHFYVEETYEE